MNSTISVKWDGFQDTESGIETFNLTLWHKGQCSASTSQGLAFLNNVQVFSNISEYTFTNLTIQVSNTPFTDQYRIFKLQYLLIINVFLK